MLTEPRAPRVSHGGGSWASRKSRRLTRAHARSPQGAIEKDPESELLATPVVANPGVMRAGSHGAMESPIK